MANVCIIYGFCEGQKTGPQLRRALEAHGHTITYDPATADVIIAHSGGCFLLPAKLRARQIILIGLPYWPGRKIITSLWRKFLLDLHSHRKEGALRFWLRKTFWNAVYFWNMPTNIRMLQGMERGNHWRHGRITTLIRPSLDVGCTPDFNSIPFASKPAYLELAGHLHDDCWRNPNPYVAVVQSEHGTRILAAPRGKKAAVSGVALEPAREPGTGR